MTHDRSDLSFEYIELLVWIFFFESSLSLISIKSRRWITDMYVHCQRKIHSFQFRWIVRLNFINSNHDPKIRSTLLFNSIIGSKKIGRVDFRNAMVNSFFTFPLIRFQRSSIRSTTRNHRSEDRKKLPEWIARPSFHDRHEPWIRDDSLANHCHPHVHFSFGINYTGRVCRSLCISRFITPMGVVLRRCDGLIGSKDVSLIRKLSNSRRQLDVFFYALFSSIYLPRSLLLFFISMAVRWPSQSDEKFSAELNGWSIEKSEFRPVIRVSSLNMPFAKINWNRHQGGLSGEFLYDEIVESQYSSSELSSTRQTARIKIETGI